VNEERTKCSRCGATAWGDAFDANGAVICHECMAQDELEAHIPIRDVPGIGNRVARERPIRKCPRCGLRFVHPVYDGDQIGCAACEYRGSPDYEAIEEAKRSIDAVTFHVHEDPHHDRRWDCVAKIGTKVVAYVTVAQDSYFGEGLVARNEMYVEPGYRRRGLATAFCDYIQQAIGIPWEEGQIGLSKSGEPFWDSYLSRERATKFKSKPSIEPPIEESFDSSSLDSGLGGDFTDGIPSSQAHPYDERDEESETDEEEAERRDAILDPDHIPMKSDMWGTIPDSGLPSSVGSIGQMPIRVEWVDECMCVRCGETPVDDDGDVCTACYNLEYDYMHFNRIRTEIGIGNRTLTSRPSRKCPLCGSDDVHRSVERDKLICHRCSAHVPMDWEQIDESVDGLGQCPNCIRTGKDTKFSKMSLKYSDDDNTLVCEFCGWWDKTGLTCPQCGKPYTDNDVEVATKPGSECFKCFEDNKWNDVDYEEGIGNRTIVRKAKRQCPSCGSTNVGRDKGDRLVNWLCSALRGAPPAEQNAAFEADPGDLVRCDDCGYSGSPDYEYDAPSSLEESIGFASSVEITCPECGNASGQDGLCADFTCLGSEPQEEPPGDILPQDADLGGYDHHMDPTINTNTMWKDLGSESPDSRI
jgi:GNAT superfamily N-acetyltransferase